MPAPNISFAKIVATPTEHAWSQAYNAGSLFLAISLTSTDETETPLTEEGKKLLNNLEAEFFTLEEKSLATITDVLSKMATSLPSGITFSLALAFIKEDILYCFVQGEGTILLKRGENRAPLLTGTKTLELLSASGHLKTDDLVLLETKQFSSLIPDKTLKEAFEYPLPNDIAETISPHVHNSKEGGASAIILAFKGMPHPLPTPEPDEDEISQEEMTTHQPLLSRDEHPRTSQPDNHLLHHEPTHALEEAAASPSFFNRLSFTVSRLNVSGQKKLMVGIVLILIFMLIGGIIFSKQDQQTQQEMALYNKIYPQALKAYNDGESLYSLNESFARDDYLKARDLLSQLEGKFPEDSTEAKKVAQLQEKITTRIGTGEDGTPLAAKPIDDSDVPLLSALQTTKGAISATENEDTIFILTPTAILKKAKEDTKMTTLVKNDEMWTDAVSIGTFGTNIYVLDPEQGVLKFVPTEEDYVASSYFSSKAPDLSASVSMAIDGSIYILSNKGSITKYTRGEKDTFTLEGLDTKLLQPVQLVTSPELDSLYLLDKGAGKVLQMDKNGTVEKVYTSDVLKDASAFNLNEDGTTIFVLQQDKVYSLELK